LSYVTTSEELYCYVTAIAFYGCEAQNVVSPMVWENPLGLGIISVLLLVARTWYVFQGALCRC